MGYLTKSRLAEFEQCEKRFWLALHRPELVGPVDASVFATGHAVGAIARSNLPGGVLIVETEPGAAVARTAEALAASSPAPIFEAAFLHGGVYVRTDILEPVAGGWRLAEVKSSSSAKTYQIADLANQVWTVRGAGLALTQAVLRLVDTSFVHDGTGNFGGLLKDVSVDKKLGPLVAGREGLVRAAETVAAGAEPVRAVGGHCAKPFECPFMDYCHRDLPKAPEFPVSLLPERRGKAIAARLAAAGFADLREAPREMIDDADALRIHEATLSGEAYHDRAALAAATADWAWPRRFLDFETVGPAIPLWAGTRPYQAIPFQFSCHVQGADGEIAHRGFLDLSGGDPRWACAEALLEALGTQGAIVTWNLPTEQAAIEGLAKACPDLQERLLACVARLVDALPLARAHYYHPLMKGSWSIKAVLPAAVPGLSYADLDEVNDGQAAGRAYLEAIDAATSEGRREALREKLTAYCRLDTLAMVELVRVLCGG